MRPVYLALAVTAVWCRHEHSVWLSHRWHHRKVTVPVSEFRLLLLCVQQDRTVAVYSDTSANEDNSFRNHIR